MSAYYNEIDPYAAQWLRNLISAGHIAPGDVDERSIEDVRPEDLRKYTQCHFFAGIGVWSYALRLAGWDDSRRIWTGSCPCQPFSAAGKGNGVTDERHLWPAWFHLITQCEPPIVIGEQVASKDAEPWLDLVSSDMEGLGFAFGALAFPSAGVGAPHIRDRLYWMADSDNARLEGRRGVRERTAELVTRARRMAGGMADAGCERRQQNAGSAPCDEKAHGAAGRNGQQSNGPTNGFWRDADWLLCRDGKFRPVEPGTFPLANGAPARVGRLRAYGNAINAEAARIFIEAALDL